MLIERHPKSIHNMFSDYHIIADYIDQRVKENEKHRQHDPTPHRNNGKKQVLSFIPIRQKAIAIHVYLPLPFCHMEQMRPHTRLLLLPHSVDTSSLRTAWKTGF